MKADVVISTAGPGSRMTGRYPDIHKTLLPYQGMPILYHIISKIPQSLTICIILGYKAEQIRDFLALAFPEQNFEFIYVDDWSSDNSGTAYSLKLAKDAVQERFWYLPCDGVYTHMDFIDLESEENCFVISQVDTKESSQYLTIFTQNRRIISKCFKIEVNAEVIYAFTGAMKIVNRDNFYKKLDALNCREFIDAIDLGELTYVTKNWVDLGNPESYEKFSSNSEFDFSKKDEFTFELNDYILKWWSDSEIVESKLKKPKYLAGAFPKNSTAKGQFYRYDFVQGENFYDLVTPKNFTNFLNWMVSEVWEKQTIEMKEDLLDFYKVKTTSRIEMLESRLTSPEYNPSNVDNIKVKNWKYYFNSIDWDLLIYCNYPSFIHGDLQFDNIIYQNKINKFILIDWRHEFGGLKLYGDLYYDFAKLLGGILHNYKLIKKGKFSMNYESGRAMISIPSAPNRDELIKVLFKTAKSLNLNTRKIWLLVPLILWNMAPLHKEPFSNICWNLGLKYFETNHEF
jgi:choline kinase